MVLIKKKLVSRLFARKKSKSGYQDYGLIATRVVTTAFFELLVDALQSNIDLSTFKYHDSGIGTTAAAIGDTTLETKVEAGREEGTQTEQDSITYKTVAEIKYTADREITEHGIFSAASGGTLLDRSIFAAISVTDGDSIEFTYLFNPSSITADISVCPDLSGILQKIEQLNQYIRTLAPSLYALGIEDQVPEIFQRQLTDLNAKITEPEDEEESHMEDADQARRNTDLYEEDYRRP